jgi:hypothetical protein
MEPGDRADLAATLRARLDAAELVEAALARIKALDGRLGAFVTLLADSKASLQALLQPVLDLLNVPLDPLNVRMHIVELLGPLAHTIESGREGSTKHVAELFFGHVVLLDLVILRAAEPNNTSVANTVRYPLYSVADIALERGKFAIRLHRLHEADVPLGGTENEKDVVTGQRAVKYPTLGLEEVSHHGHARSLRIDGHGNAALRRYPRLVYGTPHELGSRDLAAIIPSVVLDII